MKKNNSQTGRRHGMQVVTLCISTTMVLILLGLVVLSVLTARNLSTYVRENMTMTVMLGDSVPVLEGAALGQMLEAEPWARKVTYISREQALREGTEALGSDPSEFVGTNPFAPMLEIQMAGDYANGDSLRRVSAELMKQWHQVTDVAYQEDQIDDVNRNLHRINIILLVLAALLICVCYALVSNSVRLGIYARRFSIHTMKLVGARWSFIRRPFVRQAMTVGVLAALLACGVLGGVVYALYRYQPGIEDIIGWPEMIVTAAAVFVFGFLIMMLCTLLSVNKFLRMKAGELYKI